MSIKILNNITVSQHQNRNDRLRVEGVQHFHWELFILTSSFFVAQPNDFANILFELHTLVTLYCTPIRFRFNVNLGNSSFPHAFDVRSAKERLSSCVFSNLQYKHCSSKHCNTISTSSAPHLTLSNICSMMMMMMIQLTSKRRLLFACACLRECERRAHSFLSHFDVPSRWCLSGQFIQRIFGYLLARAIA